MSFGAGGEPIGFLCLGAHGVGGDFGRHHGLTQPSQHAAFPRSCVPRRACCRSLGKHTLGAALRYELEALCAPNPPLSAWRAQTGAASGRQGRNREAGARRRQPLRPEAGPVHCCHQQKDMPPDGPVEGWQRPTSLDLIELAFRTPRGGIGDPAVDVDSCQPVPLVLILS